MPGTPNRADMEPGSASDLLPGWSSLVILLTLFVVISVVALMAILRGDEAHVTPDAGGVKAYGPADFPEIDFDEPLLPAVAEAAESNQVGGFNVPPAPFSEEGIFPCSDCHADMDVDTEPRELGFHEEIQINHGPKERWCLDCHNPDDRDHLRLVNGSLVGFDESYKLCGQCHGTIFRDWREGIHGRRRGYWNGAKSYLLCAHCHNPHAPAFQPIEPLPPPVRPTFLAGRGQPDTNEEEHVP
jgi:hypothetical protein